MNAAAAQSGNTLSENDGYHFVSSRVATAELKKMHALQIKGKLCDISITVGKSVYRLHKLVLASISEYFSDLFDADESNTNCEIHINDISPAVFQSIIKFVYTGDIVITILNIEELMLANSRFKIDFLEGACVESMTKLLSPTTWFQISNMAGAHDCEEVNQKCHTYALKNFEDIAETESFLKLPFCKVKELIADEELLVPSDEEVYSAVIKWVKQDLPNRGPKLSELMMYVKLPLLEKTYFSKIVAREPLMRNYLECAPLLLEAMDYHMEIECGQSSPRVLPRKHYKELPYIFVSGGKCGETRVADCEIYNPRTNSWHSFSSMQSIRSSHNIIGFGQLLYAFGGLGVTKRISSVEYYDMLKESWTMTTSMPLEISDHGVCSIDNSIYICGGRSDNEVYINSVYKFDPVTATYISSAPMKNNRACFSLAVNDNCIYAIGGKTDGNQGLKSMEIFDPREGKWSIAPSMSKPRVYHGVAVLDGYIYTSPAGSVWERFNIRRNVWETILNTFEEKSPLKRVGCVNILGRSEQIQYDTNTNSMFKLPPMLKERNWPAIAIMDCYKIKHTD